MWLASCRNLPRMLTLLGNSSSLLPQVNDSQVTAADYRSMLEVLTKMTKMNHSALELDDCSIESELNQV